MNLRTLKKLSKRAAPLLPLLGDNRQQFAAAKDDNSTGLLIGERKHWDRNRVYPQYVGRNDYSTRRGAEIVYTTRAGHRVRLGPPSAPRKGTIMVGSVDGYYEPEWSETTAWAALVDLVACHFTDWDTMAQWELADDADDDGVSRRASPRVMMRDLSTPTLVFAAALDMVAELGRRP